MLHCDPDTLALKSLGEPVGTPDEDAHLAQCEECQAELSALSTVVTIARDGGPLELAEPSPAVWDRIRTELDLADAAAPESGTPAADDTEGAPVVSLAEHRERRARPATWLLAAAGIGGIVVGGLGAAALVTSSESASTATVAASVDLAPLPTWDASGSAELAVTDDGQQVLTVSVDAESGADGYREVWLIDSNVEGMVSLGILDGSTGEFVVPDGVDVSEYPIVDISQEPFDGDPTHSGDSIVRGQIEA